MAEHSVIGATGVVIVATRGTAGPGEVSLHVGGASESYLAWSDEPLPRGTEVVVTDKRAPRTVEVESLADLGTAEPPGTAAPPGATPPGAAAPARATDPLLEL